MGSVADLPPDQKGVLQLILGQGRSYDEIAGVLDIDAHAVRARAHAAIDALGPNGGARLSLNRRAEVADYLLGQQDEDEAEETRDRLANSASARSWARVVRSELKELAKDDLPEIPADGGAKTVVEKRPERKPPPRERKPAVAAKDEERDEHDGAREGARGAGAAGLGAAKPSSRLGGALLIGGLLLLITVLLVVVLREDDDDGGNTPEPARTQATTGGQPRVLGQINLRGNGDALGIAQVLQQGNQRAVIVVGQELQPTSENRNYAVWLYNSQTDAQSLGFAPPVGRDGRLQGVAALPANFQRFRQLVITQENTQRPQQPGRIVLRGRLRLTGPPPAGGAGAGGAGAGGAGTQLPGAGGGGTQLPGATP